MLFFEFIKIIQDNITAIQYLQDKNILRKKINCLTCNIDMRIQAHSRSIDKIILRCPKCKKTKSIRTGSFFSKSKLKLNTIVSIIYFLMADVLQKTIAELLDVEEHAIGDISNFLRESMGQRLIMDDEKLGGENIIVQVFFLFKCFF